jgi:hypothetical protein
MLRCLRVSEASAVGGPTAVRGATGPRSQDVAGEGDVEKCYGAFEWANF